MNTPKLYQGTSAGELWIETKPGQVRELTPEETARLAPYMPTETKAGRYLTETEAAQLDALITSYAKDGNK